MPLLNVLELFGVKNPIKENESKRILERQKALSAFDTNQHRILQDRLEEDKDKRLATAFYNEGVGGGLTPEMADLYADTSVTSAKTSPVLSAISGNRATNEGNINREIEAKADRPFIPKRVIDKSEVESSRAKADKSQAGYQSVFFDNAKMRESNTDPMLEADIISQQRHLDRDKAVNNLDLYRTTIGDETDTAITGAALRKRQAENLLARENLAKPVEDAAVEEAKRSAAKGLADISAAESAKRLTTPGLIESGITAEMNRNTAAGLGLQEMQREAEMKKNFPLLSQPGIGQLLAGLDTMTDPALKAKLIQELRAFFLKSSGPTNSAQPKSELMQILEGK